MKRAPLMVGCCAAFAPCPIGEQCRSLCSFAVFAGCVFRGVSASGLDTPAAVSAASVCSEAFAEGGLWGVDDMLDAVGPQFIARCCPALESAVVALSSTAPGAGNASGSGPLAGASALAPHGSPDGYGARSPGLGVTCSPGGGGGGGGGGSGGSGVRAPRKPGAPPPRKIVPTPVTPGGSGAVASASLPAPASGDGADASASGLVQAALRTRSGGVEVGGPPASVEGALDPKTASLVQTQLAEYFFSGNPSFRQTVSVVTERALQVRARVCVMVGHPGGVRGPRLPVLLRMDSGRMRVPCRRA
jgi:hypothetical protein